MRYKRLYNVVMWLVKLLFLITIGYAASDISTDKQEQNDEKTPQTPCHFPTNCYLPDIGEPTTIRLSSFTDSITT